MEGIVNLFTAVSFGYIAPKEKRKQDKSRRTKETKNTEKEPKNLNDKHLENFNQKRGKRKKNETP